MKKYVWSETRVEGGRPFTGALPKPPSATGPFQNSGRRPRRVRRRRATPPPPPEFYADAAVVAYRAPDGDRPMAELQPKVTSSGGAFDAGRADRRRPGEGHAAAGRAGGREGLDPVRVRQPQTIRGLTFVTGGRRRSGRRRRRRQRPATGSERRRQRSSGRWRRFRPARAPSPFPRSPPGSSASPS